MEFLLFLLPAVWLSFVLGVFAMAGVAPALNVLPPFMLGALVAEAWVVLAAGIALALAGNGLLLKDIFNSAGYNRVQVPGLIYGGALVAATACLLAPDWRVPPAWVFAGLSFVYPMAFSAHVMMTRARNFLASVLFFISYIALIGSLSWMWWNGFWA